MTLKVAIGPSSFSSENDVPLRTLENAGVEIIPNPFGRRLNEEEIIRHLQDADGLIAGLEPLNRRVLSSAPRLRAVARVGIGITNVDLEAAKDMEIKISSTPDAPTEAVAEMTIACLLAICRELARTNASMHSGRWQKSIGIGLKGTKVLIVGYGRIGQSFSHLLQPFGAKILVTDPLLKGDLLKSGEHVVSFEQGLKEAQVVSLHASGNDLILGADAFDLMQDDVILLNSARAELVDEDALVTALKSGKVRSAWFDAFWEEPYTGRLLDFEQVLLTPHVATYTRQCRFDMEMQAVENLLRDLGVNA